MLQIRLAQKEPLKIEPGILLDGNYPLSRCCLRTFADVGKSDPESAISMQNSHHPAVVFLNRIRQNEADFGGIKNLLLQPQCEVLSKTTWVNKMRLDFLVFEKIGFYNIFHILSPGTKSSIKGLDFRLTSARKQILRNGKGRGRIHAPPLLCRFASCWVRNVKLRGPRAEKSPVFV